MNFDAEIIFAWFGQISEFVKDNFINQPNITIVLNIFVVFGWIILVNLLLYAGIHMYRHYRQHLFVHTWKWVVLAIDIPAMNVQTPLAVEQMFSHLAGCLNNPNIAEAFYHGYKQKFFSLEIIGIEGYIQFIIRTEAGLRDLVEASVYAQYPDAEITEIEDYVTNAPNHFPNDEYEMWAVDFGLVENEAFPIRTYREFEHAISKDTVLKDPMGTFLESFTRLGPGEQMWFQIIIEPVSNAWKEHAIEKIKEFIGEEAGHGHGGGGIKALFGLSSGEATASWGELMSQLTGAPPGEAHHVEETKELNNLKYMTPGQKVILENMENKISKIGFKTKIRAIYLAKKERFDMNRSVRALIGAINQFNVPSSNSLVPKMGVILNYFFKNSRMKHRKNLFMQAYKKRKIKTGGNSFVLNIEELATIWHFPMSHVKTPLVQKASLKTAEPPSGLPIETWNNMANLPPQGDEEKKDEHEVEHSEISDKNKKLTDSGDVMHGGDYNLG
ncbi:MAG TPA: hypothetical protein DEB09_00920 [Candidatus Magasanikbacteria bacterium]|nr:hypothetical protein [Candidatus Magasanikbacteria bacterium]